MLLRLVLVLGLHGSIEGITSTDHTLSDPTSQPLNDNLRSPPPTITSVVIHRRNETTPAFAVHGKMSTNQQTATINPLLSGSSVVSLKSKSVFASKIKGTVAAADRKFPESHGSRLSLDKEPRKDSPYFTSNMDLILPLMSKECLVCPVAYVSGCCSESVNFEITRWMNTAAVPQKLKTSIRSGFYNEVEANLFPQVPLVILRRLQPDAIKQISTSQLRAFLAEFIDEAVSVANILRYIRPEHFDVLLTNLKLDIDRKFEPFLNLSQAVHIAIAQSALGHWGPYDEWKVYQLTTFSYWIPYLPCHAFYLFNEKSLMYGILPASLLGQTKLSQCQKSALFARLYQMHQLRTMQTWSSDRFMSFAHLIDGAPPALLSTIPRSTLQNPTILESLSKLDLNRAQVNGIYSAMDGLVLSGNMILALAGQPRPFEQSDMSAKSLGSYFGTRTRTNSKLLQYMPSDSLHMISEPIRIDAFVTRILKDVFCRDNPLAPYRTAYQVHWWYRSSRVPKYWTKQEIQNIGCLMRFIAPLDMARLDLFEMAQDIEKTYTQTFAGGDYSPVQAKILFNYGRQLLHLGTGSWATDRLTAIPASVLPGIPIQKILDLHWEDITSRRVVDLFHAAAETKLGFSKAQIIALLSKFNENPRGGLSGVIQATDVASCEPLIAYVPLLRMRALELADFKSTIPPRLSFAQSRYWLQKLTPPNQYITAKDIRMRLFPFLHGLDCKLVQEIDTSDIMPVLGYMFQIRHRPNPETARCLKERLFAFLRTLTDEEKQFSIPEFYRRQFQPENNETALIPTSVLEYYWPNFATIAGPSVNQQLSGDELRRLPDDACRAAVDAAGDADGPGDLQLRIRPRARREDFIKAALACLQRVHVGTTARPRIGHAEASILKYILSELPPEFYHRIADEIVYRNFQYLQGGCLNSSQRRAMQSRIMSTLGAPTYWTQSDVGLVGCLIFQLETFDFDNIPVTSLEPYIQELGTCWDRRNAKTVAFANQCQQELTAAESSSLQDRIRHISAKLALMAELSVVVSKPSAEALFRNTAERRHSMGFEQRWLRPASRSLDSMPNLRNQVQGMWLDFSKLKSLAYEAKQKDYNGRRYYYEPPGLNLTCDWLKAAGSHVVHLPIETLIYAGNMSSIEFVKCISDFAQLDWMPSKRDALWQRIKIEIGMPSPPEFEMLGTFLLSMNDHELQQVDFSGSLDLLQAFGQLSQWRPDQLRLLANRFKATVFPHVSRLDAVQLASLGHITCGFDAESISLVNTTAYIDASVAIGELESCSLDVLRALLKIAMRDDAYGDVRGWDTAVLSSIGIVAAGLSPSEIMKLPPTSVTGFTCNAMTIMSSEQMRVFSAVQLQYLSSEAALCIKTEQLTHTTDSQKYIAWHVGAEALKQAKEDYYDSYYNVIVPKNGAALGVATLCLLVWTSVSLSLSA